MNTTNPTTHSAKAANSTQKPIIKIRLVDFWCEFTEKNYQDFSIIKTLQKHFDVFYSDTPDFLFYSAFGQEHLNYDCVRIFFTGENVRPDFNIADYAISAFDFMDANDRYLRSGTYIGYDCEKRADTSKKREKFCCYLVTNGSLVNGKPQMRDRFYDKLSKYKRIDSGGRWRNNIGYTIGNRYGDDNDKMPLREISKQEWLAEYKFNLCFENSSYPGYLTEKLFDAYMAGCIPIYWGDTSLRLGVANERERERESRARV